MFAWSTKKGFAEQISYGKKTTSEIVPLPENKLFPSTLVAPWMYNFNVLMASDYY